MKCDSRGPLTRALRANPQPNSVRPTRRHAGPDARPRRHAGERAGIRSRRCSKRCAASSRSWSAPFPTAAIRVPRPLPPGVFARPPQQKV